MVRIKWEYWLLKKKIEVRFLFHIISRIPTPPHSKEQTYRGRSSLQFNGWLLELDTGVSVYPRPIWIGVSVFFINFRKVRQIWCSIFVSSLGFWQPHGANLPWPLWSAVQWMIISVAVIFQGDPPSEDQKELQSSREDVWLKTKRWSSLRRPVQNRPLDSELVHRQSWERLSRLANRNVLN